MTAKTHTYRTTVRWTGNQGGGTSAYRAYSRNHEISARGKPVVPASSDPAFHGDPGRYNPEDLLVASLSGCHMLWYLHLCAVNKVVVLEYEDDASGTMEETADGGGHFVEVTLHPTITVTAPSSLDTARRLHHNAHEKCFIASSVNFPVHVRPEFRTAP
ncbi:MAG TPA: OsmC family protein [Burkholderiales bacterium]|jgi:organic hydroperoxide reductase OsmC/OhrA|nr:OsmC family protein [Burkholderiales bacterium]